MAGRQKLTQRREEEKKRMSLVAATLPQTPRVCGRVMTPPLEGERFR
jgi:hypothetical protein